MSNLSPSYFRKERFVYHSIISLVALSMSISAETTSSSILTTTSPINETFNASAITLEFIPSASPFKVVQYDTKNLTIICYNPNDQDIIAQLSFNWAVADTTMWVVWGIEGANMSVGARSSETMVLPVLGVNVGKSLLSMSYYLQSNETSTTSLITTVDTSYEVWGMRLVTEIQKIAVVGTMIGVSITLASFASQLKSQSVKDYFSDPRLVLVHLGCQCIGMPVIAYLLGLAFALPGNYWYSMLLVGCSPGGGPTNILSVLFRGDVGKSTVMTLFSTTLNIVTTPFWLYLLGQPLIYSTYGSAYPHAAFPWMILFIFELIYVVPAFCCYAIYYHFPKAGRIMSLILRPIGTIILLVCAALGLIYNDWVYPLVNTWQYVFVPALLPICGYILGMIAAIVCRFSMRIAITISIETGIQNVTFVVLMCETILPKPDGDMAIMMGFMYCCTMFTVFVLAVPLMLITAKIRHHLPRTYAVDERAAKMEVFDISGSSVHDSSTSQPMTPETDPSLTSSEFVNEKIITDVLNSIFGELPMFASNDTNLIHRKSTDEKIDITDSDYEEVTKY